jgi:putative phosphoribosyl transferase
MRNVFRNRTEAGQLLAWELERYAKCKDVIVLGLPRGGVPVAYEVAKALKASLDVFVVRKLGLPGHRELAMGAIATGGVRVLNEEVMQELGISQLTIDAIAVEEQKELAHRELAYRGQRSPPQIRGKTVILVDDGIATGSTVRAAIQAIRLQHPARLVVAVPTAAPSSYREIASQVDEMVALMTPEDFCAVGQWYLDFSQTTDEDVTRLLEKARHGADSVESSEHRLAGHSEHFSHDQVL